MNPRLLVRGRIKHSCPPRNHAHQEAGAALIIVLSCLVLVAGLAIALLNRVEADRSSSAAYKGGANSRNLSEYAVNVVMAQISAATTGANAGNAWASQPGAIRVYSSSGTSLVNIYKLYSSSQMVTGTFPTSDTSLTGWSSSPALYTDLNTPLASWSGTNRVTNYPILDPGATNSVQGFAISGAPNATANQPAPMPVTWLYVLQDGTLVAPTAVTTNTVTVTGATAANPITGRIAFWADDETCKVNINTAAGMPWGWATNNPNNAPNYTTNSGTLPNATVFGNYWDTPIMGSSQDHNLTWSQPWAGEYQRFPGHPATVSLSAVFPNLTTNDILAIAPRINYGTGSGSQWGMNITTNVTGATRIPSDGARLYANVDELLYATNRSSTNGPDNPLTATQINRARFFITTSSRAPDVTLFNTPRLLIWPVNTAAAKQTPYDQLIAFDGTVGANTAIASVNSYYFTRGNAYNPTADYTLARNTRLLTYLKNMTTVAVPGFGGTGILGKYPADSAQILTEIFDYIRCINLQDNSTGSTNYWYSTNGLVVPTIAANGTMGFGRMPTIPKAALMFWYNTNVSTSSYLFSNSSTHVVTTNTSTNISLCARIIMEPFIPAHGSPSLPLLGSLPFQVNASGLTAGNAFRWGPDTNSLTSIFPSDTKSMTNFQADYYPQMGGVMNYGCFRTPAGVPQNTAFPSFPQTNYTYSGGYLTNTNTATGITSGTGTVTAGNGTFTYAGGSQPATNWIYVGTTVSSNPGTLSIGGGTLTLSNSYAGTAIQTISLVFPPATNLPLPNLIPTTNQNGPSRGISTDLGFCQVRGVQYTSGDYRLLAATPVAGVSLFTNHPYYFLTTNKVVTFGGINYAHTFRDPSTQLHDGASLMCNPYYVPSSTVMSNTLYGSGNNWANGDMITNSTNGGVTLLTRYGDFDNGYGNAVDGPYTGFCDEGCVSSNLSSASIPYFSINPATNVVVSISSGFFSPNRLVPSAGVMGSLPTGVKAGNPWQTLLFRPSALTSAAHPGLGTPPDHLLLDLFNMPVVQPYAISEPLSTAGRINMNYQILPFTWIKRSTAVQAALQPEYLTAITTNIAVNPIQRKAYNANITSTNRFPLNLDTNTGTLAGFEQRFSTNGIFVSASEICSIPLVPINSTFANIATWWTGYTYTGDNSKERPYARIYPKLTTKSNTYTVHYTVQTLKKLPSSTQTLWDETKDKVLSTYRGSTTIERYVNPRDPSIPDYTGVTLPLTSSSALPYKFRIISQRQFSP